MKSSPHRELHGKAGSYSTHTLFYTHLSFYIPGHEQKMLELERVEHIHVTLSHLFFFIVLAQNIIINQLIHVPTLMRPYNQDTSLATILTGCFKKTMLKSS